MGQLPHGQLTFMQAATRLITSPKKNVETKPMLIFFHLLQPANSKRRRLFFLGCSVYWSTRRMWEEWYIQGSEELRSLQFKLYWEEFKQFCVECEVVACGRGSVDQWAWKLRYGSSWFVHRSWAREEIDTFLLEIQSWPIYFSLP